MKTPHGIDSSNLKDLFFAHSLHIRALDGSKHG
jgi:hypothetical protein